MSIKKSELNKNFKELKTNITNKINTLLKESKDTSLKVKLTETKNVINIMETDKLSFLKLKQLEIDLK